MEDAVPNIDVGDPPAARTPPPPPSPSAPTSITPLDPAFNDRSDEPLSLTTEQWDITSISALAALQMLIQALEALAEATGDVPPTPPVSRPTTPRSDPSSTLPHMPSSKETPSSTTPPYTIGSPEAHPHEPLTILAANAEPTTHQRIAIGRRFFSKTPPPFPLSAYLHRLHTYCPHAPGVYLAAATYCHRLCVADLLVPATTRTVHRLALASIRVAAKALEDHKWTQERMAKVGGVSNAQLMNLEVALCFLLDFELWVDERALARGMFALQQAARQGVGARGKLGDEFRLRMPSRRRSGTA